MNPTIDRKPPMPRKRSISRVKLTDLQRIQLLHPFIATSIPAFDSAEHRKRWWVENRERLMAAARPGHRPVGWWDYESPRPRAHDVLEAEQLPTRGLPGAVGVAGRGR